MTNEQIPAEGGENGVATQDPAGGVATQDPAGSQPTKKAQPAGGEIPTRPKDSKDYIIERLQRKAQKQEDALKNIDKNDIDIISKIVEEKFSEKFAKIDKFDSISADQEVDRFLQANPHMQQFGEKIREYYKHPSRESLPIESIANEIFGEHITKEMAKSQAGLAAGMNQLSAGSPQRQDGSVNAKDWKTASTEELEKEIARVKAS